MRRLVLLLIACPMLACAFGPQVREMMLAIASRRDDGNVEPDYWKITVETDGADQDFSVNINSGTAVDLNIEWESGTVINYDSTGIKTHTFANAGSHDIKIWGDLGSVGNIRFNVVATRSRLKESYPVGNVAGILNFQDTFRDTGLRSLNPDLFRWNTLVSTSGFRATFRGCTGLEGSIPEGLFANNTQVSTDGFRATFFGCTGLEGAIPEGLFANNTLVSTSGFRETFRGCAGLTSAPSGLFKNNANAASFYRTFYGCTNLQIDPNIFWDDEGDVTIATRFDGKTVDFFEFFRITSAHQGTQGTAPALWDAAGTLNNPANAFTGHSTDSLSNYDTAVLEGWATE